MSASTHAAPGFVTVVLAANLDLLVDRRNGVVRLTGTVTSQSDRLRSLISARANAGVRSVVGDLRVERN